jgi:hypothetical protein
MHSLEYSISLLARTWRVAEIALGIPETTMLKLSSRALTAVVLLPALSPPSIGA